MMGFGGGLSFIWPLLGLLLLLGALALVVVLFVWSVRRSQAPVSTVRAENDLTLMELARRRLALGEITLEEYEQVRSALTT
jgi:uncharacterized membrane protein